MRTPREIQEHEHPTAVLNVTSPQGVKVRMELFNRDPEIVSFGAIGSHAEPVIDSHMMVRAYAVDDNGHWDAQKAQLIHGEAGMLATGEAGGGLLKEWADHLHSIYPSSQFSIAVPPGILNDAALNSAHAQRYGQGIIQYEVWGHMPRQRNDHSTHNIMTMYLARSLEHLGCDYEVVSGHFQTTLPSHPHGGEAANRWNR